MTAKIATFLVLLLCASQVMCTFDVLFGAIFGTGFTWVDWPSGNVYWVQGNNAYPVLLGNPIPNNSLLPSWLGHTWVDQNGFVWWVQDNQAWPVYLGNPIQRSRSGGLPNNRGAQHENQLRLKPSSANLVSPNNNILMNQKYPNDDVLSGQESPNNNIQTNQQLNVKQG